MNMRDAAQPRWAAEDYADQACKVATHRIEECTRYGDTLNLTATATRVVLQRLAVDVQRTAGVRIERQVLPGRDATGTGMLIASSAGEAAQALDDDVQSLPTRPDTLSSLAAFAGSAPYAEVQGGRYLGTRGRDIRWHHTCDDCGGRGQVNCVHCSGFGNSTCSSCGGSGSTTQWSTDHDGHSRSESTICSSCSGGRVTCTFCMGSGRDRCRPCEASGWLTECSLARAIIRERRQATAQWSEPELARIVGGTITLETIGDEGLAALTGQDAPAFSSTGVTRRFHFALPAATVELGLEDLRKPVYIVGYKPRLQLAEAFLDEILKDDVAAVVQASSELRWRSPWRIFAIDAAWQDFRENEIVEALLTAASQVGRQRRRSLAALFWVWRRRPGALDARQLHAAIDGSVSIATIQGTIDAAEKVVRFARAGSRCTAALSVALSIGLGMRYGGQLRLSVSSITVAVLALSWSLAELLGWWLTRPLGPFARAR